MQYQLTVKDVPPNSSLEQRSKFEEQWARALNANPLYGNKATLNMVSSSNPPVQLAFRHRMHVSECGGLTRIDAGTIVIAKKSWQDNPVDMQHAWRTATGSADIAAPISPQDTTRVPGVPAVDPVATMPAQAGSRLLDAHVVLDRLHARDTARYLNSFRDIGVRRHEAAQLNRALECFDVDFTRLQDRLLENRCLDLGCDDGVVDILGRAFRLRRGCASGYCYQQDRK